MFSLRLSDSVYVKTSYFCIPNVIVFLLAPQSVSLTSVYQCIITDPALHYDTMKVNNTLLRIHTNHVYLPDACYTVFCDAKPTPEYILLSNFMVSTTTAERRDTLSTSLAKTEREWTSPCLFRQVRQHSAGPASYFQ